MSCEHRHFLPAGLLASVSAVALALVSAWGAPPPEKAPRAQPQAAASAAPGAANDALSAAARPLVKASDTPHLLFLFTDQVVGYVQPCG